MVAQEWFTCWSIYLELSGMRRLYLRNGERGSLLIKVIKKNQVITGALHYCVVWKVFCNNRLVEHLDRERAVHEGQAGFRKNESCIDNVYTLNEVVQGRLREDKPTYAFFLDVQKAYDTVWRDGLWLKLWDMGVKGKMWRVLKGIYVVSRSAVLLEGEKSNMFSVEQGVAQGCSLSPILFSVFINDLLKEVEEAGVGVQLCNDGCGENIDCLECVAIDT